MARIKLKSAKTSDFNTNLVLKGVEYHIQTEKGGEKHPFITTTAYLKGTIIDVIRTQYHPEAAAGQDAEKELLTSQHTDMIERLKARFEEPAPVAAHEAAQPEAPRVSRAEYNQGLKLFIGRKQWRNALDLLDEALVHYPGDPFFLSYYGYLKALVSKEYKNALSLCKEALDNLKKQMPVGGEFYYPMFYLNLGRVCVLYNKKDKAINFFRSGLKYDPENKELFNEIKKLGFRKTPPIPFLSRDNVLNKYLGKTLAKLGLR